MDLFATDFLTRDCCGEWLPVYQYVYILGDMATTFAYLGIPCILAMAAMSEHRQSVPNRWTVRERNLVRAVFAAFILVCGLGHMEGPLSFFWPAYHFFAVWHGLTGLVSLLSFFVIAKFRASIVLGV